MVKISDFGINHLGSTTLVTNYEGDIIENMNGEEISGETTPFGDQDNKSIFYTGKQWDEDAELYYFNARWYDPETGRFITEDPIKDGNLWHAYVGNNPMNRIDPTGLEGEEALTIEEAYLLYGPQDEEDPKNGPPELPEIPGIDYKGIHIDSAPSELDLPPEKKEDDKSDGIEINPDEPMEKEDVTEEEESEDDSADEGEHDPIGMSSQETSEKESSIYYSIEKLSAKDFGGTQITQNVNQDNSHPVSNWYTKGHPAIDLVGSGAFFFNKSITLYRTDKNSKSIRALFLIDGTDDILYISHAAISDIKGLQELIDKAKSNPAVLTYKAGSKIINFPTTLAPGDIGTGAHLHIEIWRKQEDGSYWFVDPLTGSELPYFQYKCGSSNQGLRDWVPKFPGYESWWGWY